MPEIVLNDAERDPVTITISAHGDEPAHDVKAEPGKPVDVPTHVAVHLVGSEPERWQPAKGVTLPKLEDDEPTSNEPDPAPTSVAPVLGSAAAETRVAKAAGGPVTSPDGDGGLKTTQPTD